MPSSFAATKRSHSEFSLRSLIPFASRESATSASLPSRSPIEIAPGSYVRRRLQLARNHPYSRRSQVGLKGDFLRVGDGGVHSYLVRFRSVIGSVTMLMLLIPDWRRVSMTEAKIPNGTVSSQRRKTASCFLPSFEFTLGPRS